MTGSITFSQLINPTPEELEETAQVAIAAFQGDQFTKCCLGGDWDLSPLEQRAIIGAQQVGGENWVARDGDRIVAFAGWYGPGRALLDSPEQAAAGWNAFGEAMPPKLHDWWMEDFLPAYEDTTNQALGKGTKLGIWHLQLLATHPDYQRRGIATKLVKIKERLIAKEGGSLICLESEKAANTDLYKSWNWEVKGQRAYTSPYGDFDMWVLAKVPSAD